MENENIFVFVLLWIIFSHNLPRRNCVVVDGPSFMTTFCVSIVADIAFVVYIDVQYLVNRTRIKKFL